MDTYLIKNYCLIRAWVRCMAQLYSPYSNYKQYFINFKIIIIVFISIISGYNSKYAASEMSGIPDCVSYAAELNYYMDDGATIQMEDSTLIQRNNARTGKKIRPYFCSGCRRAYTRVDSLKRHQLKCDNYLTSLQDNRRDYNQHYCKQCGKSYRRRDTLQRHQRLVCGYKEKTSSYNDST